MFKAVVLLTLASVLLAALALISCLSVEDKRELRGLPRWAWVMIILLVPTVGPVAYFLAGRPVPAGRSRTPWPLGGGLPEQSRPQAPDDDPEFLRSINQSTLSAEDEKLLQRWEEDLRRREDEQHRRDRDT